MARSGTVKHAGEVIDDRSLLLRHVSPLKISPRERGAVEHVTVKAASAVIFTDIIFLEHSNFKSVAFWKTSTKRIGGPSAFSREMHKHDEFASAVGIQGFAKGLDRSRIAGLGRGLELHSKVDLTLAFVYVPFDELIFWNLLRSVSHEYKGSHGQQYQCSLHQKSPGFRHSNFMRNC